MKKKRKINAKKKRQQQQQKKKNDIVEQAKIAKGKKNKKNTVPAQNIICACIAVRCKTRNWKKNNNNAERTNTYTYNTAMARNKTDPIRTLWKIVSCKQSAWAPFFMPISTGTISCNKRTPFFAGHIDAKPFSASSYPKKLYQSMSVLHSSALQSNVNWLRRFSIHTLKTYKTYPNEHTCSRESILSLSHTQPTRTRFGKRTVTSLFTQIGG